MKTLATRSLICFALANLFLLTSTAQQPSPSNPPASQPSQPADRSKNAPDQKPTGKNEGTSNDRLFFALPNFLTLENSDQVSPLTTGQKFKVVTRSSFDYVQIPWYAFLAGIGQAQNSEPGYGQGAEGYGKRFGASFSDGTIENFMTGASFRRFSTRILVSSSRARVDFGIVPDTRSAASLLLAPIPGTSNSTSLRFLAAPRRPPFPPTATTPAPIALSRTPPAYGEAWLRTTP